MFFNSGQDSKTHLLRRQLSFFLAHIFPNATHDQRPVFFYCTVTGNVQKIALTAEGSWRGFGRHTNKMELRLSDDLPVLLVTGGSKGAQTINRAVEAILPRLLSTCQVLHLTGSANSTLIQLAQAGLPADLRQRYHAFEFLHNDMGAAMAAADLAISRSGASTLGEYPFFGLPAILVPYPFAWRYQKVNAAFLEKQGAAVLIPDEEMAARLLPVVLQLFSNADQLKSMRTAMQALARPNAAREIAGLVRELAASRKESA